jgi:hypothetical protein
MDASGALTIGFAGFLSMILLGKCTYCGVGLYNLGGLKCLQKLRFRRFVQIGGLNCTFSVV